MPFSALKMGPGNSSRSHSADEYIYIDEIKKGIELYVQLLEKIICYQFPVIDWIVVCHQILPKDELFKSLKKK